MLIAYPPKENIATALFLQELQTVLTESGGL